MGTYIHAHVEVYRDNAWHERTMRPHVFDYQSYGLFGFLVDIRNFSCVPSLGKARGVPDDSSIYYDADNEYLFSASFVSLKELLDFDYGRQFEDRRATGTVGPLHLNYGNSVEVGQGRQTTYREFLPPAYFEDLARLESLGNPEHTRIVFWFS